MAALELALNFLEIADLILAAAEKRICALSYSE
jgi:hypothetical protein